MDLNVKLKTRKLLEVKEENLCDLELGNDFLDMTPKAQYTKETGLYQNEKPLLFKMLLKE